MMLNNSLHKRPGRKTKPFRVCAIEGCDKRAWKDHLYCPKHSLRAARHGDPSVVLPTGRKKAST